MYDTHSLSASCPLSSSQPLVLSLFYVSSSSSLFCLLLSFSRLLPVFFSNSIVSSSLLLPYSLILPSPLLLSLLLSHLSLFCPFLSISRLYSLLTLHLRFSHPPLSCPLLSFSLLFPCSLLLSHPPFLPFSHISPSPL